MTIPDPVYVSTPLATPKSSDGMPVVPVKPASFEAAMVKEPSVFRTAFHVVSWQFVTPILGSFL